MIIGSVSLTFVFFIAILRSMDVILKTIEQSFNQHAFAVLLIIGVAYIARKLALVVVTRLIRRTVGHDKSLTQVAEDRREKTLIDSIGTALRIGIWIIAGMMLLEEFGVNIAPLLAGAGVIGVALGFGAQSIVKDALSGLLIIFENQYRIGDVVQINSEVAGVVEKITLRETVLRDLDGMVHHVPNGYVQVATNMTMEFSNVNIDIGVSYNADIDQIEKVINDVGDAMAHDKDWRDAIIEAPAFLRVDSFADSAIVVKILGKTTADQRWAVAGEFRRRLKAAFDKNDIEIPFPQLVVHG
ncbi:MAG: mechanosensitive ion channel family protein, partial [Actinobacteria bacterium]|nr:mechanosensitive ion channel family protein [Actinomycetota bacterium]